MVVFFIVCLTGYGLRVYELVGPASAQLEADPVTAPGLMTTMSIEALSPRATAELNLFGEVRQMTGITPAVEFSNVPKTKLDLTLNAVFTGTTPAEASAVIAAQNNGLAKRYFINEILPGNAVLYGIYPDHVILKRGEHLEKLVFPRDRPE